MSHFPHGKCGLKFELAVEKLAEYGSLPSREVWVEIIVNMI